MALGDGTFSRNELSVDIIKFHTSIRHLALWQDAQPAGTRISFVHHRHQDLEHTHDLLDAFKEI